MFDVSLALWVNKNTPRNLTKKFVIKFSFVNIYEQLATNFLDH